MHVLFLLSSLAMGGAERNVVSVLPYFQNEGIKVSLCTLNKRRDSPLVEDFLNTNIPRYNLGARRMVDYSSWIRFTSLLDDEKVDVVHAEDQDSILYAGTVYDRRQMPVIMTRHVLEEPASALKSLLRSKMVLWTAKNRMNRVIAVSEAVRNLFSQQANVPTSKISTIYNGIDLQKFQNLSEKSEIRKKLGWHPSKPTAILVSVLRPGKGIEIACDAVKKVLTIIPDFQLKIVGSGEMEGELKNYAANLYPSVEFLGQRMDIPNLMNASDLLIQSSWSEALPTVLIEAGAASLPVIATRVGGTEEIVHDGVSGYLINAGDVEALSETIIRLCSTPQLQVEMGEAALSIVSRNFSLATQAKKTITVYEDMLRHIR
jgi:glycosyltransferase involved in cell wall biosynthesis